MRTRILVFMLLVIVVVATFAYFGVSAQDVVVQPASPLPPPSPTVETQPLDPAARRALEYATEVRKLSPNQLAIRYREDVTFPTLQRSFVRFVIAAPSDAASAETELLVDVASDAMETNVDAWIATERMAYTEKYGRLNPGLYERLQQTDDQERLPVAIWVARTEQDMPVEELLEAAADDDPAALDALRSQGIPWAVADEEQAQAIHERYVELLNAEVAQRVAPLAAELRVQGHAVTEFTGMPALSTLLNKPEIEKLAGHPLVAEIFLVEAEGRAESAVAVATDRVPQVWQRGYNGAGVKIAILEAGNINQTARNCLTVTATRDPGMASNDHKSRVAAIAACNSAALPGVAKGASVLDAGFDDSGSNQQDNERFTEAVIWAGQTQTADVINISYGFDSTTSLHFTDRVADYWARWEKIT
ncbi:MAG: S8 family serine peptidase, partial [Caldilinea sp.]